MSYLMVGDIGTIPIKPYYINEDEELYLCSSHITLTNGHKEKHMCLI